MGEPEDLSAVGSTHAHFHNPCDYEISSILSYISDSAQLSGNSQPQSQGAVENICSGLKVLQGVILLPSELYG